MTEEKNPLADAALKALRLEMDSADSDSARVSAAKFLFDKLTPKKTDEEQKHETEEGERAIAEARQLLDDIAHVFVENGNLKNEVARLRKAAADNAGR